MRIGGFIPFTLSDFPGRISAVVFTQGCNFRCPFCHNPSLVVPELFSQPIYEESILNYLETRRGKLDGVVVSGGEPTIQCGLIEFIKKIKELGFLVKLDTNGSNPEVVEDLITQRLIDYCAMDIKAPWSKYSELSGVKGIDISPIQKTLEILSNSPIEIEFRTTFAQPLLNENDIEEIRSYLPQGTPLKIQKFNPHHALQKDLFLLNSSS